MSLVSARSTYTNHGLYMLWHSQDRRVLTMGQRDLSQGDLTQRTAPIDTPSPPVQSRRVAARRSASRRQTRASTKRTRGQIRSGKGRN